MRRLRSLLTENERYPTWRTFDRQLKAIPATLSGQSSCLGRYLVETLVVWPIAWGAAAVDSTPLRAVGGVWHQTDRKQGKVPNTAIDTEVQWTMSGWHGWVYG